MKNDIPIGSIIEFKSSLGNITIAKLVRHGTRKYTSKVLPFFVTVQVNYRKPNNKKEKVWPLDLEDTHFEVRLIGDIEEYPEYNL